MPFNEDFNTGSGTKRKWVGAVLAVSLALNAFGIAWYVSRGYVTSNLPLANIIREIRQSDKPPADFGELELLDRMTRTLSPEGGAKLFQEYARRKPALDALVIQLEKAQSIIKQELARETVDQDALRKQMESISRIMSRRMGIMLDLMGDVLPQLSTEDRQKLGIAVE